ncbi:MAG: AMP-binding protein, partial [Acidimicrobiales bacterium]
LVSILRERELTYILGLTRSSVMVVQSASRGHDYAAMLDRVLTDVDGPTKGFAVGLTTPVGRVEAFAPQFMDRRWEDETDPAAMAECSIGPDDLAEVQFTSGTTGEPKGVMHTSNTIYAGTRAFAGTAGLADTDSILMPSTLGHQTG